MSDNQFSLELNSLLNINKLSIKEKKLIGKGSYGEVYNGKYFYGDVSIAIKKILINNEKSINREVKILNKLKHPNVPIFYGILGLETLQNSPIKNLKTKNKSTSTNTYTTLFSFINELIEGPNFKDYYSNKNISNLSLILLLLNFTNILIYCHSMNIIHRDLKPTNIMIDKKLNLKLLDYGISKYSEKTSTITEMLGTIYYMAPECFNFGDNISDSTDLNETTLSKITNKVDVWAFGCTVSEVFSKEVPWSCITSDRNKIFALLYAKNEFSIPNSIKNIKIRNIIQMCTRVDPTKRATMEEVKIKLLDLLYEEVKLNKEKSGDMFRNNEKVNNVNEVKNDEEKQSKISLI